MAWLPSKPESNDRLKNSQVDIKNNFTEIDTSFSVNHASIGSGADEGKHKIINLIKQTADQSSGADEMTIFERVPATAAIGTLQNVFISRNSSVSANARYIPLTAGVNSINADFNTAGSAHAHTFLGTGLCEKFGYIQFSGLGGTSGALANNTQRNNTISLTNSGPNYLANAKLISAHLTLCTENQLSFGSNNTMVYIRWGATTNTSLAITIVNQTGDEMPANTRIMYRVVGQVDLTTT